MVTFKEMKIPPALCEALRRMGIEQATEVQGRMIPPALRGDDLIAIGPTGTGKTLAFLLPLLERIKPAAGVAQGLIVAPTRELALQTAKVAEKLGAAVDIAAAVIYGGKDIEREKAKLRRRPEIIIGTPGRLLDHLRRGTLDLSRVHRVVIDEADELLRRGFLEDAAALITATSPNRQLMLFSATMPEKVRGLARRFMTSPQEITIAPARFAPESVEQKIINTTEDTKIQKLCEALDEYRPYLAMVFCATRERAAHVALELARRGYGADELHGGLSQVQRHNVLEKFRSAKLQVLTVTDIAARGLDIPGVTHVFNYDLPQDSDGYIHRIGRTGRAGQRGMAVTLVNVHQYDQLRCLEVGLKKQLAAKNPKKKAGRETRTKSKPLSKYANRKGADHKGYNPRSRRQKPGTAPRNQGAKRGRRK